MIRLTLHLLGPVSATLHQDEQVEFGYDKVRALFAYLAAEPDQAHPRSRLAALLWPEKRESVARHSLSQALSVLRRALDERSATRPILQIQRNSVQFNVDADVWVDLLEYQTLLQETERHEHESRPACRQCLWQLERAVQLVRGPFLEGFSLPDSEEFEDWVRARQQSIELSLSAALRDLIHGLESFGDLGRACEFGQRLIELDPWDEPAHRTCMRLFAASGKRAAAIKQFENLSETLQRDLGVEPEEATVELYERIRAGLEGPTSFKAVAPPGPAVHSTLPVSLTTFVGREDDIEQLGELVEGEESRLITLTGPGGIGKTRLAVEVARSKSHDFPDGVYFIPLAGLTSATLLPSAILDVISAKVDRQADPREELLGCLQRRRMLLVLDNFEHLVEGSLLVAEMLEAADSVQVLVTSRERLSLTGEWVYEVDGLSLPASAEPTAIATSGAARLFNHCARKHKASYLPRQEDGPAVARICRLTGGMPLALELAAVWITVLSPDEIADEIEQSLDFLSSTMRDLPERHQSVRAVLDRSWKNLTEVEQRAFRRLSVFLGGFRRAAASYVTGAYLPILSGLVSKSLLRRDPEGRYEIHELLRQYGESRLLAEDGEVEVVRDRHRDYYIGFLAVRREQLEGRGQESVLVEITGEIENIRAAWQRSVETGDVQGLSRAAHCLWLFCETTGRYSEGAAALGNAYEALSRTENIPEEQWAEHHLALARVRARQAALNFRLVGPGVFKYQLDAALELARLLDEPGELGIIYNFLAVCAHIEKNYDEEEALLIQSIEQFERAGYQWGVAYSQNDLGHVLALRGDYLGARSLHQSALGILEELGDRRGIAFALRNLGLAACELGDTQTALALLQRSLEVRRPIGNQWGIAESLKQIGVILRDGGQIEAAKERLREALTITREIGAMQLAAEILDEYVPLLSIDGDPHQMETANRFSLDGLASGTGTAGPEGIETCLPGTDHDTDQIARVVDRVLTETAGANAAQATDL